MASALPWVIGTASLSLVHATLIVCVRDRLATRIEAFLNADPAPIYVAADGPLALKELPEWAPSEVVYKDFATPFSCVRCGGASTRYRAIQDALVCTKCRRSFDHTA